MFRGISAVNLDGKGRLSMPSRYREQLQMSCEGQVVVTIDTEVSCLLLYPMSEWEAIEDKLQQLPSFNRAARRIQRLLIGHATELLIDNNGRLLLPQLLRDYADLTKKVILVGQGKKFEIWDEQQWQDSRDRWLVEEANGTDVLPQEVESLAL